MKLLFYYPCDRSDRNLPRKDLKKTILQKPLERNRPFQPDCICFAKSQIDEVTSAVMYERSLVLENVMSTELKTKWIKLDYFPDFDTHLGFHIDVFKHT